MHRGVHVDDRIARRDQGLSCLNAFEDSTMVGRKQIKWHRWVRRHMRVGNYEAVVLDHEGRGRRTVRSCTWREWEIRSYWMDRT